MKKANYDEEAAKITKVIQDFPKNIPNLVLDTEETKAVYPIRCGTGITVSKRWYLRVLHCHLVCLLTKSRKNNFNIVTTLYVVLDDDIERNNKSHNTRVTVTSKQFLQSFL
ncbi:MAG: hypothetical protein AB8U97_01395 [Rickettsia endosymbiont of Haemaphysalis japonica]